LRRVGRNRIYLSFDPLSYFPHGVKDKLLPPWEKAGKGVMGLSKIIITFKDQFT
jgi:hypothetical protein